MASFCLTLKHANNFSVISHRKNNLTQERPPVGSFLEGTRDNQCNTPARDLGQVNGLLPKMNWDQWLKVLWDGVLRDRQTTNVRNGKQLSPVVCKKLVDKHL